MPQIQQINNLRAIAVIAVVLNHFSEDFLPNGFLGVDIFFVISGFVVTKSLLCKPKEQFLISFFLGRLQRLYPALLVNILITSILAIFLLNSTYSSIAVRTGSASLVAMANIFLIKISSNYFALETSFNPFTHTWSLSVEEQFYLIYPLMFYICIHVFKKSSRPFGILLLVLSVISLGIALNGDNPTFVYYSILSRFWQLALGCISWLLIKDFKHKDTSFILYPLLFALIISLSLPSEHIEIVRIATSVLTAATLAILASTKKTKTFLLENKAINYVGLCSYSLYLWHWPILSFARATVGLNILTGLLALILIAVLTFFSYNFVETKFRHVDLKISKFKQISFGLLIIGTLSASINRLKKSKLFIGNETFFAIEDSKIWDTSYCYTSRTIQGDKKNYERCDVKLDTNQLGSKIFIYGNSYAKQMLPALAEVAKEKNFQLNIAAASFCHPLPYTMKEESKPLTCYRSFQSYFAFALNNIKRGDFLVLAFSPFFLETDGSFNDDSAPLELRRSHFMDLLIKTKLHLNEKGARLILVGSIPLLKGDPNFCYQPWSSLRSECNEDLVKRSSTKTRIGTDKELKDFCDRHDISYVDTMPLFLRFANTRLVYYNQNHVSHYGSLLAKNLFLEALIQ